MQDLGRLLAVLGGAGFLAAVFLMPTTVPYGGDAVTNLSLQQQQMIAVAASLTLVLAGTILAASGAIADALRPAPPAQDAEADHRLVALGITRQGKDYVFNGFVYRTEAEATAMAEQAAQRR